MRDYILMFSLAFVLLAWINLHSRRTKEKKGMRKEAKEILLERLKSKAKSVVREGWKAAVMKKIGDLPQENRRFKKIAYPYLQKNLRSGKERRNSRVQVGITFEHIDRRQADITLYTGSERRTSMDRRGKSWDRRKPKVACYS